MLYCKQLH